MIRDLDPAEAARIAAQYGAIVRLDAVTVCPPRTFAIDEAQTQNWLVQREQKMAARARQEKMAALKRREERPQPTKADVTAFAVAVDRVAMREAANARKNAAARERRAARAAAQPARLPKPPKPPRRPVVRAFTDAQAQDWLDRVKAGEFHERAAVAVGLTKQAARLLTRWWKRRGVVPPVAPQSVIAAMGGAQTGRTGRRKLPEAQARRLAWLDHVCAGMGYGEAARAVGLSEGTAATIKRALVEQGCDVPPLKSGPKRKAQP